MADKKKKRYIVAKKLNRSNARRTELTRFYADNDDEAINPTTLSTSEQSF